MSNSTSKIIISLLMIAISSTASFAQTIIRVNCGGNDYWDTERNLWRADQPYTPGSWGYENPGYFLYYDYPISGTNDDPLYQYEHNALDNYKFTVPNGTYVVTLKFAELYYDNVGERVFHVEIEGDRVLNNFDIISEVGFAAACDKTFIIDVTDGILDVQFITIEKEPGVTLAHANVKAIGVVEQGTHEPKLWVDPHELDFFDYSYKQSFKIKNGGELPLEWSCAEDPDQPWITSVSPTSGTLYQEQSQYVEVQVSRSGLPDGHYEGNIAITSNGGNDNVKVLMDVVSKVPILQVQPTSLHYGAILTQMKFNIKNVGTADLNWSAKNKNNYPWIKTISPASGKLEPGKFQEVQVTTDRTGLTDSTYQGNISVETNGGVERVDLFLDNFVKPLNVNCGGSGYSDQNQQSWFNDLGFVGGQPTHSNAPIENTADDQLYQYARIGMTKYQFAVQKNGYYRISLHFAELQHNAAGKRLFDVWLEDRPFLQDFDIFADHGKNYAVIKSTAIEVIDQQLDISFIKKTDEPCIAGIEIHQIPYLQVDTTALNFASILTKRNFTIKNTGTLELQWSAKNSNNDAWLQEISPSTGLLAALDSQVISVTIDRTNFTDSLHNGAVALETTGGNQTIALLVETKNSPLRINCGGSEYQDQSKNPWLDDMLFVGGQLIACQDDIANTIDDQLYQTARAGMTKYEFPLQRNGWYKITLHFAEFEYEAAGKRIFDVTIEDQLVLENFDIFAQAGAFSAGIKSTMIEVTDKRLDLAFIAKVGEPCISGLEVYLSPLMAIEPATINFGSLLTQRMLSIINIGSVDLNWSAKNKNNEPWLKQIVPSAGVLAPNDTQLVAIQIDRAELTDSLYQGTIAIETDAGNQNITLALETRHSPLRVNCGGAEFVDTSNSHWFEDISSSGGYLIVTQENIAGTADDQLYQTARAGVTKYQFPVQHNGWYGFALHFAEFQHQTAGARIFDVQIENSLVLKDFDIYAEAGTLSAVIKTGRIEVTDQQLDIVFIAKVGEPIIAAIEIYQTPLLAIAPSDLKFGSLLIKRTFAIINAGSIDMSWTVKSQPNQTWLKQIVPLSGVLAPSDTQWITVTIDRQELADSLVFEGSLQVETNGGNQDVALKFDTTNEPLRLNCGGVEFLDVNQNYWFDDLFAIAGYQINCQDSISQTEMDWLYQTARSGMTRYELPIQSNGLFQITLHFAEIQHQSAGKRIFDVQIEDSLVLKDFDIVAEAGALAAVVKPAKVKLNDNQLDIVFVSRTGEACIAGIEVAQLPELPTGLARSEDQRTIPERFQLEQNYPNPFNLETRIAFQLPIAAKVTLEVYNLLGQKQKTLLDHEMAAGFHSINWDGSDLNGAPLASGLYIYKIQVTPKDGQMTSFQQVRKMLLLK